MVRFKEWLEDKLNYKTLGIGILLLVVLAFWLGGLYNKWQDKNTSLAFVKEDGLHKEIVVDAPSVKEDVDKVDDVIAVHIAGAVEKPGVYHLKEDQRICDVLEQACPQADADTHQLNLAQRLIDGQKIVVPTQGQSAVGQVAAVSTDVAGSDKVSINHADLEELMTLPAIGEVRAQDIIRYREKHGAFKRLTDLKNVPGIGDKLYSQLEDEISL